MSDKVYMTPNPPTPNKGQKFDPAICNGCNLCVEVCPTDVMMPNPEKKKPPIVLYPEECWFCAACIEECPDPGPSAWPIRWLRIFPSTGSARKRVSSSVSA